MSIRWFESNRGRKMWKCGNVDWLQFHIFHVGSNSIATEKNPQNIYVIPDNCIISKERLIFLQKGKLFWHKVDTFINEWEE